MSSSQLSFRSIMGVPEYQEFQFQPTWIFYSICTMIAYSIPPIFIFCKISFVFLAKKSTIKKSGIRWEIFYSFILMQFWNIVLIIADFAMFRVGYTTILTRYCASENPQAILRTIVFVYFWATYASQFFTMLFCALRVAVLFSVAKETSEQIIKIVPPIIVIFGLLAALPHFTTDSYCLQLSEPMIFGSVLIISKFHSGTVGMVYVNLAIYLLTTVTIAVLNVLMMRKVRRKTFGGILTTRSATQSAKIEKTLTGTMIILLFPMIVSLLISIGEILRNSYFSYILLIRPFFLDARVHIVTCYFYATHPVFKKTSPSSSVTVMSRATL